MFFGTTPAIISQYLEKELIKHNPKKAWVLFSGNFVVEQIVGINLPKAEIHATDISLYSKAIGHGICDEYFDLKLNEDIKTEFKFIGDVKSPLDLAVQTIFLTEVAPIFKKAEKHTYYKKLLLDAKKNEQVYFDKIKNKLIKFKENVKKMKFYGIDACELIKDIKKNDLVFYDPPVLLGDYEKMFAPVESCYTYKKEEYQEMNDEVKENHLQHFNKIGAICYYRTNNPLKNPPKGYKEIFRYQYKYEGNYCLYSNRHNDTFVGTFSPLKEETKNYKMISKEDVITENSKIRFVPVTGNIANHYRLLWVKKATMTNGGIPYLIELDGKLIGVAQIADAVQFGTELAIIFSDPSCPYSNYARLSKLILNLICTKTFLKMFNDKTMWEHKGFTTRVFTNAPISMKYRGLFNLAERVEDDGNYKYKLIYHNTDKFFKNNKDALRSWLQKDGKKLNNE